MQHTLVAVFDNRGDAKNAMDELLASGFSRTDVNVSSADPTGQTDSLTGDTSHASEVHESIGAQIKHFFTSLFGSDNDEHVSRYSDVVSRGHHVLTLTTQSEPEVERAADIIERFGPVDLDERHDLSGAASSLDPAMLAAGASSGSGLQRASSMSQQSDAYRSPSYGAGSLSGETGERNAFGTQDLNDPVPKGQTYQEPLGGGLRSGDSLQAGSSLQGTDPLGGTIQTGSMQRDMGEMLNEQRGTPYPGAGGGAGSGAQRSGMRVVSRSATDTGIDDDSYFRSDWQTNYSSLGGSYDDYAPAYRYGSQMRKDARYSGRNWDDVESDLRSDWDTRYGTGLASTWERMKAAIRRGWDKLTPDSDSDDSYYRSHWSNNYATSGDSYNDYDPAYRYGTQMRRDARYAGRNWDDVESDLRSDWDTRYGRDGLSTWERMKAAVRHGWDKLTA